jgi:2-amino-4-hydroxy-6-hydroxymethyldihydropteridine diphosphokinase
VTAPVTAYIGVGANLGNARAAVCNAIAAIADLQGVTHMTPSSLYGSAPVDSDGSDYVNAVVRVQTTLSPHQLLAALQNLEHGAGRTRNYRNAPRTLDLDVLLFGSETIHTPDLTIPHPRMWERAFVLAPLAELDPRQVTDVQREQVAFQKIWRLP